MTSSSHPDSRAANQSKAEPFPASATESEAETPGSDHPGGPGAGDAGPASPTGGETAPGSSEEQPVVQGLHVPEVDESDPRS